MSPSCSLWIFVLSLTACLGEELGDLSDFATPRLIFLIVLSICGFTEIAPNKAVARSTRRGCSHWRLADAPLLSCRLWRHQPRQLYLPPIRRFSQGQPCDEHLCSSPRYSHHLWIGAPCLKSKLVSRACLDCGSTNVVKSLSDGVVHLTALEQIILNAGRAVLEKMVRDPGRSTQVSLSSHSHVRAVLDG